MCCHMRMAECVYVNIYAYSLCEASMIVDATFSALHCIVLVIHDYIQPLTTPWMVNVIENVLCWLNSGCQLSDVHVNFV